MIGASSVSSGYFRYCIAASLLITTRLQAQDPQEFFESKVRPLLASRCHACHGPKQQMGGLDLSTAQGLYKATNGGPLIVKGNPGDSRLIQAVNYLGKIKMPPHREVVRAGNLGSDGMGKDGSALVEDGRPFCAETSGLLVLPPRSGLPSPSGSQ
jgi:hypothetical protein